MDRDERRRVRELVRVDFEELVDAIFGLAGRVPVGLLSKVVLVVLRGVFFFPSQHELSLWHAWPVLVFIERAMTLVAAAQTQWSGFVNETHETVHEPIGKVSVEPRDFDDPGDPSLVPPFRDDSLFLEIVIWDAIPRQADHLGEVMQSVSVYGVSEDEDGPVREPRERLDVLSCDLCKPVGGGFARRRVGDPFSAEWILLVIVLWGPPGD